jgi:hypothetical protein
MDMRPTPDTYPEWTVQDLINEREVLQWQLAEYSLHTPDETCGEQCNQHSREITEQMIEEIENCLSRRRELARRSPFAPSTSKIEAGDIFRRVKADVSLERFCERYGPILRQRGRNAWGLCPLPDHHEVTGSFKVNPERDTWYCFGCHRGGDIFTLAQYYYQESSVYKAAQKIASEFGINMGDGESRGVRVEFPKPGKSDA